MHLCNCADAAGFGPDVHEANWQLRVFIAYDEIAAGKHALRAMAGLGRRLGEDIEFHPALWSFDRLTEEGWGEVATGDAVRADILIVATDNTHPLPSTVRQWIEAIINCKQGTTAAVVALFGPEENPDQRGSHRLEKLRSMAHGAGLDFFETTARHRQEA